MTRPNLRRVTTKSYRQANIQDGRYLIGLMLDTITVVRAGLPGPLNYTTGLLTDTTTIVYSGMAKASNASGGEPVLIGDELQFWDNITVTIPDSAPKIIIDDVVTIVNTVEQDIVGRKFRVTSVETGGFITASQTFQATGVAPSRTNPAA